MIVSLVGLPGSGKSTVGRRLARRLQIPFFDSDQMIEERSGCSILEYFEQAGEEPFRDLEEAVIDELTQSSEGVLATGGGVILRVANREHLRDRSRVVYLNSPLDDLFFRLRHDAKRPLLQVADPVARLRELHAARDPLYRQTAHLVIETSRPSVAGLVDMIMAQLELCWAAVPDTRV